jgi:RNA polymerase sigma factor (sigma-70 family)
MDRVETSIGGAGRRFPSTSWAMLRNARDAESPDRTAALQRLASLYWKPVYCFIRRAWKKGNEDAKDLTQEFFLTAVLQGEFITRFAPERGSFRAFLKAAVTNFLRDAAKTAGRTKRGGGASILRLDITDLELADVVPDADARTPEQVFDEAWRSQVLGQAAEIVEQRLRAEGRAISFEVFKRYDLDSGAGDASYKTIGDAMGLSPDVVKHHLIRAREEFRYAVTDVVSEFVDNETDLSLEIDCLLGRT